MKREQPATSLSLISAKPIGRTLLPFGRRFRLGGAETVFPFVAAILARANPAQSLKDGGAVRFFLRQIQRDAFPQRIIEKSAVHHHWHSERIIQKEQRPEIPERENGALQRPETQPLRVRDLFTSNVSQEYAAKILLKESLETVQSLIQTPLKERAHPLTLLIRRFEHYFGPRIERETVRRRSPIPAEGRTIVDSPKAASGTEASLSKHTAALMRQRFERYEMPQRESDVLRHPAEERATAHSQAAAPGEKAPLGEHAAMLLTRRFGHDFKSQPEHGIVHHLPEHGETTRLLQRTGSGTEISLSRQTATLLSRRFEHYFKPLTAGGALQHRFPIPFSAESGTAMLLNERTATLPTRKFEHDFKPQTEDETLQCAFPMPQRGPFPLQNSMVTHLQRAASKAEPLHKSALRRHGSSVTEQKSSVREETQRRSAATPKNGTNWLPTTHPRSGKEHHSDLHLFPMAEQASGHRENTPEERVPVLQHPDAISRSSSAKTLDPFTNRPRTSLLRPILRTAPMHPSIVAAKRGESTHLSARDAASGTVEVHSSIQQLQQRAEQTGGSKAAATAAIPRSSLQRETKMIERESHRELPLIHRSDTVTATENSSQGASKTASAPFRNGTDLPAEAQRAEFPEHALVEKETERMIDTLSRRIMARVEAMWTREMIRRGGIHGI